MKTERGYMGKRQADRAEGRIGMGTVVRKHCVYGWKWQRTNLTKNSGHTQFGCHR